MMLTLSLVGSDTSARDRGCLSILPFLSLDRVGALFIIAPVAPRDRFTRTEPPSRAALSVCWGLCTTRGTTWGRCTFRWGKKACAGGEPVDDVHVRPGS